VNEYNISHNDSIIINTLEENMSSYLIVHMIYADLIIHESLG